MSPLYLAATEISVPLALAGLAACTHGWGVSTDLCRVYTQNTLSPFFGSLLCTIPPHFPVTRITLNFISWLLMPVRQRGFYPNFSHFYLAQFESCFLVKTNKKQTNKKSNNGKLAHCLAIFEMQTILLYLHAWLLSSAFRQLLLYFLHIYSCYVQEDYQKPEAHSISLSLLVSHGLFLFIIIYHFSLWDPGELFWCPKSHSLS